MSKKCEQLKEERRKKLKMDDHTLIRPLDFDCCSMDHCNCGCNIQLGMTRIALLKLMHLIESNFTIEDDKSLLSQIYKYIANDPLENSTKIPPDLKMREK